MTTVCDFCKGQGRIDKAPFESGPDSEPCPKCGPVAKPAHAFYANLRGWPTSVLASSSVESPKPRQRSGDQCLDDPKRLCSRCRRVKPVGKFSVRADGSRVTVCTPCRNGTGTGKRDGFSKAQMAARLPCGLCVCGEPLAAHVGVGRCLVCACPEFFERSA